METIFLIVLAAFNVWTIYFYNKLLLEVANGKEKEKKPPIDPMALVGKSLFKVRIPTDTRSPIPVISVQSVGDLQYRWQS